MAQGDHPRNASATPQHLTFTVNRDGHIRTQSTSANDGDGQAATHPSFGLVLTIERTGKLGGPGYSHYPEVELSDAEASSIDAILAPKIAEAIEAEGLQLTPEPEPEPEPDEALAEQPVG